MASAADTAETKSVLLPPRVPPEHAAAKGREFDRSLFEKTVNVTGVVVDAKQCQPLVKSLSSLNALLHIPKVKAVLKMDEGDADVHDADSTKRVVLLSPDAEVSGEAKKVIDEAHGKLVQRQLTLGYDHWTADEVLRAALPEDMDEITSSFEAAGHIAHMNLRDSQLPYRFFIGQVIFDKNKQIKTVVNKLNSIDTTFRFFKMELLAGEPNYVTTVKENGCSFTFDFSKVYWNSRLHKEHERVVGLLASKKDVLCDPMAGVGPFAVPAAKLKRCRVYANDLNPNSYEALRTNCQRNKVDRLVTCFNMDAREFIRDIVAKCAADKSMPPPTHFVMNLPATAIEFLDAFRGLYKGKQDLPLPTIHCHCFSKAEDPEADVVQRVEAVLQGSLEQPYNIHDIRDVAPKKRMLCISFPLPEAIAFGSGEPQTTDDTAEPDAKKPKLNE